MPDTIETLLADLGYKRFTPPGWWDEYEARFPNTPATGTSHALRHALAQALAATEPEPSPDPDPLPPAAEAPAESPWTPTVPDNWPTPNKGEFVIPHWSDEPEVPDWMADAPPCPMMPGQFGAEEGAAV